MKNILLIGGGHSHVLALLRLAEKIPKNARITLISDSEFAPYSGMLPGFTAGQFSRAECLINLPALCARVGADWKCAAAAEVDCKNRKVKFSGGGAAEFDILSINVGGAPHRPFAGIGVKPAQPFMDWLESLPTAPKIAVIGAGAGGVETALALRHRFPAGAVSLAGDSFLPGANTGVRRRLRAALNSGGIAFYEDIAESFSDGALALRGGGRILAEHAVFATPAAAPGWLKNGGLILDEKGFIRVNAFLQTESSPEIFAAGDCAASGAPKSGVVAVRQAPVLADNILAALSGNPPRPWRLSRRLLSILNTANGRAVAGWGGFSAEGAWVWAWKKYLDKKFMNRFDG